MLLNCYIHPTVTICCPSITQNRLLHSFFKRLPKTRRFEGGKVPEPRMEKPCLFLDLHVNILRSVKTVTAIFYNHQWRVQQQCIGGTDLGAMTNDSSGTSFISARKTPLKWGRAAYVSELHYQLLSAHVALGDMGEKKKRNIWQKIEKTIVSALVWKPNSIPSRHLVLLMQKLIIHCSKQTFPSGLSRAVQILLAAHLLDTSSPNSQYYFSIIWMD